MIESLEMTDVQHKEEVQKIFETMTVYPLEEQVSMYRILGELLTKKAKEDKEAFESKAKENEIFLSKMENIKHAG